MTARAPTPAPSPGGLWRRALLWGLSLALFVGFLALGDWQLQRRTWKLALIARVEQRVHAPPVPAPGPDVWAAVTRAGDEYRRVRLKGRYDFSHETLVQALTAQGSGYWVLTPLRTDAGYQVLINRGFTPTEAARRAGPEGEVQVIGLVRISEPGGGFLRRNDPAAERWYSRDVTAIAKARGLTMAAPYFIDAEASAQAAAPLGGLTVIAFPNSHLVYALTWFALAAMVGWGMVLMAREQRRAAEPASSSTVRAAAPIDNDHGVVRG